MKYLETVALSREREKKLVDKLQKDEEENNVKYKRERQKREKQM